MVGVSTRAGGDETSLTESRKTSYGVKTVVLIINYNRPGDTVKCVKSLLEPGVDNACVVVMDNGSASDNVGPIVQALGERISILSSTHNIGVAAGWNESITRVRSRFDPEYILLLNNDTEIDSGVLRDLVQFLDAHQNVGAAGPSIVNPDNPSELQYERHRLQTSPVIDYELCGCALIVRTTVFDEIGMFDEDFFIYAEETDLLHRMRRSHYSAYYVPTSGRVRHRVSSTSSMTSGFEAYHRARNLLLFGGKNLQGMELERFLLSYFFKWIPRNLLEDVVRPRCRLFVKGRIAGAVDGIRLLRKSRIQRRLTNSPASKSRPVGFEMRWLN